MVERRVTPIEAAEWYLAADPFAGESEGNIGPVIIALIGQLRGVIIA